MNPPAFFIQPQSVYPEGGAQALTWPLDSQSPLLGCSASNSLALHQRVKVIPFSHDRKIALLLPKNDLAVHETFMDAQEKTVLA